MYSILYVDDEPALLDLGKMFLEQSGTLRIDTALSAADAIKILESGAYEGIISDYQMPEMDGIEFLKYLRSHGQYLPFVLFTGRGREEVVIEALNSGADFYLQKGGDPKSQFAELEHKIRQAIDRQRTHMDLSESRQQMADIINFLPDATFAIDLEGRVIAWNRAIEEMAGIPKEEILGTRDHSYAIPFYGKKRPLLLDLILRKDPDIEKVYPEIKRKDNKLYSEIFIPSIYGGRGAHLWFIASPLYDTKGNVIGAIESIRDITNRKEAEEALAREKVLLDAILGSIPGSFFVIDRQGRYVRWNKRQEELIGLPPDKIRTTTIFSMIHEEDRHLVEQKMAEVFEKGYAETEARFLLRDRNIRNGFLIGRRLDIEGSSYIVGTGIDITAWRLAETEVRRLFQYKESVLKNTNMLVFTIDCSNNVIEWSPTAETMSGFPASEVIGSSTIWKQLYPEKEYRRQITEKINRIIRDRNYLENFETTIRCRNGEPKTILWNTRPLFDERNRISGYLVIGVDITERRMAEDALNLAIKKISLLSSITRHDILNQLSALRGYLELSRMDPQNAGMLEYIGKEEAIAETITQQIEFSRDYQELGISSPQWQDVMATVTRAVSTISLGPVTLSVDTGDAGIYADPLLERVFYNLVDNALRYGGNLTRITVSIKESDSIMVLVFEDNGVGVPLDQKKNIFNRKFFHNTGLGLFLSHEILAITGITITETGEPGKGARFEMTVPKGGYRFPDMK